MDPAEISHIAMGDGRVGLCVVCVCVWGEKGAGGGAVLAKAMRHPSMSCCCCSDPVVTVLRRADVRRGGVGFIGRDPGVFLEVLRRAFRSRGRSRTSQFSVSLSLFSFFGFLSFRF